MLPLQRTGRILDPTLAIDGIRIDPPRIAVAHEGNVSGHVAETGRKGFVVETGGPGEERQRPGGEHSCCFKFWAVGVAVEVLEGVDGGGEDGAFPGVCRGRENGAEDVG